MADIQLGVYTLRSHGTTVARFHMHDWIIVVLLAILDIILNVIEPFHRFVGQDMMTDLRYPLKSNTIPFFAVPLIGIVLPAFIIMAIYFKKQNVYDLHNAILGLLFSALITGVLTDAIKDAVGRPRPDFFWRCFPDGKAVYDNITTNVICHGDKSVIKEGHKSFPSGHSSCLVVASFCYLQFFPPPYDSDGWGPHAYFHVLAESQNNPTSIPANNLNMLPTSMEAVYIQSDGRNHMVSHDSSPMLDEMEAGFGMRMR